MSLLCAVNSDLNSAGAKQHQPLQKLFYADYLWRDPSKPAESRLVLVPYFVHVSLGCYKALSQHKAIGYLRIRKKES